VHRLNTAQQQEGTDTDLYSFYISSYLYFQW